MKRQLSAFAISLALAGSAMAQDSYYPAYESDNTSRQFNFNPGNMMNGMSNPMRNMFGSSGRRYDDYPNDRYTPPAYAPGYGYPAYPGYQPPAANYGYTPQQPAYPLPYGYAPLYGSPPQAEPAPAPEPAYQPTPAPAMEYSPRRGGPNQESYRFRPLEAGEYPPPGTAMMPDQGIGSDRPAPAYETAEPPPSSYPQYTPQGPAYPQYAPQAYPEPADMPTTPASPPQQSWTPQDENVKFRPLDKPGYSSDLGQ